MSRRSDSAPPAAARPPFDDVVVELRRELLDHVPPSPAAALGWETVETNSGYVERRGRPIAAIACERIGVASLEGTRLVDLGCGFGGLSALFAFEGADVVAVDRSRERLDVAARVAGRHGLAVRALRGRMERLDLPDASFDVAVMNNSLVYVVDSGQRLRALSEARRVLAPGGVLVMRNANRLYPVDQFTGLPLIHLLPPATAVALARRLGRRRSLCRPRSSRATRAELVAAGFAAARDHPVGAGRRSPVARYTHLSALRPG